MIKKYVIIFLYFETEPPDQSSIDVCRSVAFDLLSSSCW